MTVIVSYWTSRLTQREAAPAPFSRRHGGADEGVRVSWHFLWEDTSRPSSILVTTHPTASSHHSCALTGHIGRRDPSTWQQAFWACRRPCGNRTRMFSNHSSSPSVSLCPTDPNGNSLQEQEYHKRHLSSAIQNMTGKQLYPSASIGWVFPTTVEEMWLLSTPWPHCRGLNLTGDTTEV